MDQGGDHRRLEGLLRGDGLFYDSAVESETKAALFDRFIAYSSWHHTGTYARETEFFALDEEAVVGAFRELEPEEAAERDRIRAQAAARARGGGTASEGSGMPIRVPLLLLPI